MNHTLERPGGPKTHREQMILRAKNDLLKIRIVAGNAMRERQGTIGVDLCLEAGQTVPRESIPAPRNSTPVSTGIRREAHKVQPVSQYQSDEEYASEQPRKHNGRTYPTAARAESRCGSGGARGLRRGHPLTLQDSVDSIS